MERLVSKFDEVCQAVEMPDGGMQINRLDRIATGQMNNIVGLREPDQIAEIGVCSGPAAIVAVRAIGRGCDLRESDLPSADGNVALAVAGMQREGPRRMADHFHDQPPVEADPFAALADIGARCFQPLARFGKHHVHADLFKNGQGCIVNGLKPFRRDDLGQVLCVQDRAIFERRRRGAPLPLPAPAARPAAAFRCACGVFNGSRVDFVD